MSAAKTARLAHWITHSGSRLRTAPAFVEAFAETLGVEGVPVERITTGITLLHPLVFSSSCVWVKGQGVSERIYPNVADTLRLYENSPLPAVYGQGQTVRCQIGRTPQPDEFPILADLRAEKYTDYVVMPLQFTDGSYKAMSFATRRRGGFLPAHLALLQALISLLAMVLETETLRRTARTLMETYVGPHTGARVLEGSITRGMQESIAALIWLCDLRGFTALSESLPGTTLIALLNDYFGAMCEAVSMRGGEVLKFIGDAMLAIFPLMGRSTPEVAHAAIQATRDAERAIAALNAERQARGDPIIRYGLALHTGEVLYGNIGGPTRLDFTVIGPAVNVAARVQGLCEPLGRRVLLSGAFAALVETQTVVSLGEHRLKGIAESQPVYGLAEE